MESYIYKRNKEGVFYLDLAKSWEKTMVAARIIAAIQDKNKKDVLVSAKNHHPLYKTPYFFSLVLLLDKP